MRPITVSVGPLAAAVATGISNTSPVGVTGGQLALNGSIAAAGPRSFNGAATWIAGNPRLTITNFASGMLSAGLRLNGRYLAAGTTVIGPAPGSVGSGPGSIWIVNPPPVAAGTVVTILGSPVAILDAPRQITITNTEVAPRTFTVFGTDAAGTPISETLLANGGNLTTQQNFATVTEIDMSVGPPAAVMSAGTAPTATSQWVNFDPWARGTISYQTDLAGAANYTVQITNDDPNSPTSPVAPGLMSWLPDPNAGMVGASTPQAAYWPFTPLYARVLLNSGAGAVSATFVQQDGGR